MSVNLTKNQVDITKAWKEVCQDNNVERWALLGYEGSSNNIYFMASGTGGLSELINEFNCTLIQYALCRVIDNSIGLNKMIIINWQGESAPLTRKGLCASHVTDVSNYFKGWSQTITLRNDDEASVDYIMEQVKKSSSRIAFEKFNDMQNKFQSSNDDPSDNDECLGRRSELLRHERSQETSSLITKGSIRDKRAMFEQGSAPPPSFHSSNTQQLSSNSTATIQKITVPVELEVANNKNINEQANDQQKSSKEKEKSPIEISSELQPENHLTSNYETKTSQDVQKTIKNQAPNNKDIVADNDQTKQQPVVEEPESHTIDGQTETINYGIRAKALYDYQEADETEISFDPDDIIGHIEKVDQGWWHGKVLTGTYAGKVGLFPSNYVEELG